MTSQSLVQPLRAYEHWLAQYKRVWRGTLGTSVVNPLLYLAALGVGLGSIVDRSQNAPAGVPYLDFIAPGLLAAAAMQTAATEASWPVLGAIKWTRTYYAMTATPLTERDVLIGHQLFVISRVLTASAAYLLVVALFGAVSSWLALLALPVAVLIGTAFSMPLAAYAATTESDSSFPPIFRFVIVPMFLFSGTFFPVDQMPLAFELVAYLTPIWHGVELCRQLTLGDVEPLAALGHLAYLLAWTIGGLVAARRAYRRRLFK
ncbi:MAG: ABC transporter permease [Actinobacteria bacterium]|nr:ABC transporter permease [Actinomycetota bacterium]